MPKRRLSLKVRIPPHRYPRNAWRQDPHAVIMAKQAETGVHFSDKDRLEVTVRLYGGVRFAVSTTSITAEPRNALPDARFAEDVALESAIDAVSRKWSNQKDHRNRSLGPRVARRAQGIGPGAVTTPRVSTLAAFGSSPAATF